MCDLSPKKVKFKKLLIDFIGQSSCLCPQSQIAASPVAASPRRGQ